MLPVPRWGVAVVFLWNDRGLLEVEFFVDDLSLDDRVGEHVGQVDVVEFAVFVFVVGVRVVLEVSFDFEGFRLVEGS